MALVIRTWNVFHGNTDPPGRRAYLRQMVELVTRDKPDVVCLQELPVWSLPRLSAWSGMHAVGAVARRPLLRRGAKAITDIHHGRLRSALTGEAGAILSTRPATDLGVTVVGEKRLRRIAQTVELDGVTVVNFHVDGDEAQLERVLALPGDRAVVAGDTNLRRRAADGYSPPLEGSIDQIYVRGLEVLEPPRAWPVERRTLDGRVLSDHAPVEAVVE
ncbi:MAG TPA: endonuclease/exonuclease/phosphatase family protein [Gaiellaceae bacterium]|jgi:endonuclease/exonuclease/phosphatase family metal-dependent hydrolase